MPGINKTILVVPCAGARRKMRLGHGDVNEIHGVFFGEAICGEAFMLGLCVGREVYLRSVTINRDHFMLTAIMQASSKCAADLFTFLL